MAVVYGLIANGFCCHALLRPVPRQMKELIRPRGSTAWLVLVAVTVGTGGGIWAIHKSQQTEREVVPAYVTAKCPQQERRNG